MPIELTDFHFLRGYFFWLLIPTIAFIYWLTKNKSSESNWQKIISPHLLPFLLTQTKSKKTASGILPLSLIMIALILALSGPSFRQKQVPIMQSESAQILVIDLSLSMNATDIKPSRLERAKFKLQDLLKQHKEGNVALIVYAGDAFIISPLTSDANTIASIIPTLSTDIMPVLGSRPDLAIRKAIELLENNSLPDGEIIWLTDGVEEKFVSSIISQLQKTNYQLSILGVGTSQGAPIPLPGGRGFVKDAQNNIVLPKYETKTLQKITDKVNAGYIKLTANNSDIQYLEEFKQWKAKEHKAEENNQTIERWVDDGYWLIWIVLGLFMIKLIRQTETRVFNLLLPAFFMFSCFSAENAQALDWDDLWLTKNQQAKKAFENKQYDKAEQLFQNKDWQATAQYKNGNYENAADNFLNDNLNSSDPEVLNRSLYNHATSLAKAQKLPEALEQYNQLLEKQPNHKDALHNKKIIEDLLKQQKQQGQDKSDDSESQEKDSQKNQSEENESKDGKPQQDKSDSQEGSESKDSQQKESQSQSEEEKMDEEKNKQAQKALDEQDKAEAAEKEKQQAQLSEDQRNKSEKDQALDRWLGKIPEDPGGFLRRKMIREYQKRDGKQKEQKPW